MPVHDASFDEIDKDLLDVYFFKTFESSVDEYISLYNIVYEMLIKNLHLTSDHFLNLAGLLLFGKNPGHFKPAFIIKAVSFFGNDITNTEYRIISPGKLPNNVTVENIILGNTVIRNNIITSFASKLLPYRGLGTGIRRVLKEEKDTQFYNDTDGDQFIVTIPRPHIG